jgi:CRP/FNR family transcriptional regulator
MSDPNDAFTQFIENLKNSPLFAQLSEKSLAFLKTQAKQTHYRADEMIFLEGEPSAGLYWLQSGALKAVKYSTSGREQILHLIKPGQSFNEVGAFSTLPNPVTVVALEPVQIWHIPGDAIRKLIQQDSIFAQSIIDMLSARLRHTVTLVEDLSLRPVISRLSRLILDEADGDILLRPTWYTQNELAARLGTVADVIQRSLRKLEADDLIKVERQRILIINRDELESLAS